MTYSAQDGVYKPLAKSVPHYPEDLDMYSFMFEYFPNYRADIRNKDLALFIDEETGNRYTFNDVKNRVDHLAVGLREKAGVGWDTCVGIFSANCIDYATMIWASHRLGAIVTAANPSFQPSELSYQLESSKATFLFVNQDAKEEGFNAAEKAGIPREKVALCQDPSKIEKGARGNGGKIVGQIDGAWTVAGLIEEGKEYLQKHGKEALDRGRRKLKAGEAKSKLAFLSFSSGTTGLPKGVAIQHSSPIANILQFGQFNEISSQLNKKEGRFRPGIDVSLQVLPTFHIYGLVLVNHAMFFYGITSVIVPKFKGIGPMLETCVRYSIGLWWLVPPQVVLYCKSPDAQKYHAECRKFVRFVMIGAAPLSDDLSKLFMDKLPGIDWGQGYGMT